MTTQVEVFRRLHASGCFVMPNPWDLGSATFLEQLGFPALATTSAGHAWSRARADAHVSLEVMLAHFREMAAHVHVPLNGDFEGGYAVEPEDVAANVARAAETGVAGLSIEDSTGDPAKPLHDFALSVERVRAARRALAASGVVLTARSEGFVAGRPDLKETIRRLTAYAEAGADCLYAPGLRTEEEVAAVVRAVSPRAVNVLAATNFTTVARLRDLGVRRISTGGTLARVALTAFLAAAREIAKDGTFTAYDGILTNRELNGMLGS
jgi:2-methylisocitrate lyase-like PEP mutase family enzyme